MECNSTRKLIDEADRPDSLSLEVEKHLALCDDCRLFADERAQLRYLLASTARVQAPQNFDATLCQRLESRKAARSLAWFSPASLVRAGAAAAAMAMVIFMAKVALWPDVGNQGEIVKPPASIQGPMATAPTIPPPAPTPPSASGDATTSHATAVIASNPGGKRNRRSVPVSIDPDLAALDPHFVIVRGDRGDVEVPILTISVGAQPRLYGASRPPQPRLVRTSF